MPEKDDDRERIIRLEQAVGDAIPAIREALRGVSDKQDAMNNLVVELVEQNKRFPVIDEDMRQLRVDVTRLQIGHKSQEERHRSLDERTKKTDADLERFINSTFVEFSNDMKSLATNSSKNTWTLNLVRAVVFLVLGGAVSLAVSLLTGGIGT